MLGARREKLNELLRLSLGYLRSLRRDGLIGSDTLVLRKGSKYSSETIMSAGIAPLQSAMRLPIWIMSTPGSTVVAPS